MAPDAMGDGHRRRCRGGAHAKSGPIAMLTQIEKQTVLIRYLEGVPVKIIRADLSISRGTITTIVKQAGVPFRRPRKNGHAVADEKSKRIDTNIARLLARSIKRNCRLIDTLKVARIAIAAHSRGEAADRNLLKRIDDAIMGVEDDEDATTDHR